jgi:hypothetical protein
LKASMINSEISFCLPLLSMSNIASDHT